MNIELKTKLEEINRTILHNMQFLMEEQSNQIQEAVIKTLPKENISKDELWDLLNMILPEIDDVKIQVNTAKDAANSIYSKVDSLQDDATEVSDQTEEAVSSLRNLESTIRDYRTIAEQEAA